MVISPVDCLENVESLEIDWLDITLPYVDIIDETGRVAY